MAKIILILLLTLGTSVSSYANVLDRVSAELMILKKSSVSSIINHQDKKACFQIGQIFEKAKVLSYLLKKSGVPTLIAEREARDANLYFRLNCND